MIEISCRCRAECLARRSYADSPDVDALVYVYRPKEKNHCRRAKSFLSKSLAHRDYDLIGASIGNPQIKPQLPTTQVQLNRLGLTDSLNSRERYDHGNSIPTDRIPKATPMGWTARQFENPERPNTLSIIRLILAIGVVG